MDLSEPGSYLGPIAEATKDIDVQLIFNNAGYILTGFFERWYASGSQHLPSAALMNDSCSLLQVSQPTSAEYRVQQY